MTSSVSGKRSPAELNAHNRLKKETRADDETRTRDPHLGKVMRYQLRYIRISIYIPKLPEMSRTGMDRARYWDRTSDLFRVREALSR